MTTFQEFHDPRLVALYDLFDPARRDLAFFLDLVEELAPASVVDVGCGTGVLTCALALRGYLVTGVDPAAAMLEVARNREGGDLVRWVEGDAGRLEAASADLALMTAHVAQVIADDEAWQATLDAVHRALRPGGRLIFDSRNPAARAWLKWTPETMRGHLDDTPFGPVDAWWEVTAVRDESATGLTVESRIHYRFQASEEEVVSDNVLRFRSLEELSRSLSESGFAAERVFGDWDGQPLDAGSPEFIVVATLL